MQKAFDKVKHPLIIKTLNKVGSEGTYLNIKKAIYEKPTGNIILKGEKMKAFVLRSGKRRGCLLPPLLVKMVLEVLATAIRQQKEVKGIPISTKEIRLSLFVNNLILYIENPKDSTKKLLN